MIELNDSYLDALIRSSEPKEIIAEPCAYCMADLYAGEEVIVDGQDNVFCDYICARSFYCIEEIYDVSEDDDFTCVHCGEPLSSEYEGYLDGEQNPFCSCDCAESYREFNCEILESGE